MTDRPPWADRSVRVVATFDDGIGAVRSVDGHRLAVLAPRRPDDQVGVDDDELARRPRVVTRLDHRFNGRGLTHDRRLQPGSSTSMTARARYRCSSGTDAAAFGFSRPLILHSEHDWRPEAGLGRPAGGMELRRNSSGVAIVWAHICLTSRGRRQSSSAAPWAARSTAINIRSLSPAMSTPSVLFLPSM
ncbi:MAG: hypothetical protein ACFCVK_11250 [Acidimicrobiales bacterium]